MQFTKRVLSLVLSLLLVLSLCVIPASAEESGVKTVKLLCYNIAGLPSIGSIMGMKGVNVPDNQLKLGKQLNQRDYDVIAVQEDFNYHCFLSSGLTNYKYKTNHTGGVPGGDGMNVFSKYPLYNEKRTTWEKAAGVFDDGDELTPKGILYTALYLGDGLYVDFYVIHADAFDDENSRAARNDNFRQLYALIESRGTDRPVIVTGDFNTSSHLEHGASFTDFMITKASFTDAWTKLYNGNNYDDYSVHGADGTPFWGNWDSVEKVLYRDGGNIHVDVTDFNYLDFFNGSEAISDHKAAEATITFTPQDPVTENTELMTVTPYDFQKAIKTKIYVTLKDVCTILNSVQNLLKSYR